MKNDLINGRTPEEIVEANRHCSRCFCDECAYFNAIECQTDLKRDCADLIKHLEAKQPKWIGVNERLPEKRDNYLTVIHCPKGDWIEVNGYCHLEERWEHDCGYHTEDVTDFVTHWMPMPEPPKEAEHAD